MTIGAQIKLLIVHSVNCIRSQTLRKPISRLPLPAPPTEPLENPLFPACAADCIEACKVPDVRLHVTQTRRSGIQIHDLSELTMPSEVSLCGFWMTSA